MHPCAWPTQLLLTLALLAAGLAGAHAQAVENQLNADGSLNLNVQVEADTESATLEPWHSFERASFLEHWGADNVRRADDGTQDLLDVWRLAQSRDPIYAASGYAREADQELIPQARAQLLPYVTAGASSALDNTRRASTLSDSRSERRAAWSLTLVQPLFDLSAWNALERADLQANQADIAHRLAWQDLLLRTAQAYFDVLAAQDSLRALLSEKAAVETQLRAAQQGFELGATTITDAHEAQARLDLVTASEINLRNELQLAQDALARIIAERPRQLGNPGPNHPLTGPRAESS